MSRQMTMIAFLQAQNCSNLPSSWRHPASMSDFLTPEYYQRIGRILEDGKFHMAFFDDRLAMPDIYGNDYANTVAHGVRAVKLDLVSIVTAMAMATSRLGLGATYSTTYYEPYHVARTFATLDLMTRGRIAWNVVTSLNNSEAMNFGRDEHLEHDLRYDRADEFMQVVMGHWGSWDDDALILDKQADQFADPTKVHRLNHTGRYFRSRGPFTVPRSPQGHPVLLQAGQSGRGRTFAARWGEVIFVVYPSLTAGKMQYADFKAAVAAEGRDPDRVHVAPACYVIAAESADLAAEKKAFIESLPKPIDGLTLLSEVLNYDLGSKPYDEPLTDAELDGLSWHGFRDRVVTLSGKHNPSVRDFVEFSGRGTIREHHAFVGTPKMVADQMEEWFEGRACDGFVMAATHMPGAYEDFVRLVVPELQRRGLYRKDYGGPTLRENLGMPKPSAAECRAMAGLPLRRSL
jgi:FMN-dependent oxidoreductase (nitrilotriacetate monooxygenase family)